VLTCSLAPQLGASPTTKLSARWITHRNSLLFTILFFSRTACQNYTSFY
jgi:hypothetical protein